MSDKPQTLGDMADEFLIHLGQCITEWAHIEDHLFKICRDILGTATEHTAIIYYKTPSLEARLTLTDELIDTIFPPPESGEHRHDDYRAWAKIIADIRQHAPTRNRLAHSPVGPNLILEPGRREMTFQSMQPPTQRARRRDGEKPAISLADLQAHIAAVAKIDKSLGDFRCGPLKGHIAKLFPQNIGLLTGQY
jgi:hypothetical protein